MNTVAPEPYRIIGPAGVKALDMAGFDIVRRPPPPKTRARFTCPHCGVRRLGGEGGIFADYGEVWCERCVSPSLTAPSRRGHLRPMLKDYVPR